MLALRAEPLFFGPFGLRGFQAVDMVWLVTLHVSSLRVKKQEAYFFALHRWFILASVLVAFYADRGRVNVFWMPRYI